MTESPGPLTFRPESDLPSQVPKSEDPPIREDLDLPALEWCDSDR